MIDERDKNCIEDALVRLDELGIQVGSMYITDTVVPEAWQSWANIKDGQKHLHENPTVQKAWENYQTAIRLVK